MKTIIIFLLSVFSLNSFAGNYFLRKLYNEESRSTLFMACYKENTKCRVLAGGSLSQEKVDQAIRKLRRDQLLFNSLKILAPTISVAINPYVMMSFLTVPATAVTLVGSIIFVVATNDSTLEHQQIELLSNTEQNAVEAKVIERLDKILTEIRAS